MDVDAAGAAEGGAAALLGVAIALDAGHEREQIVPVANRERQVRHLDLRDHRAERRVVRVQQLRRFGDGHRLAQRADGELHIEPRALADFERHHLRNFLEPGELHVDAVASRNQVHDLIRAGGRRHLLRRHVRREIGDDHGGAGHDAAAGVLHDSAQRGAIHLCERSRRMQQKHGGENQHAVQRPFHESSSKVDRCIGVLIFSRAAGADRAAATRGATARSAGRRSRPSTAGCPPGRSGSRHRSRTL